MLLRAALVPDSPLLLPGTSGREPALGEDPGLVAACRAAVGGLLAAGPEEVVVVAPGPTDRVLTAAVPGRLVPSAGALGAPGPAQRRPGDVLVQNAAAGVGVHLLAEAGRHDGVRVVEVTATADASALAARGADLARASRVALLLTGALSARRSARSPLPEVDGAVAADDAVLADLLALDGPARARLLAASPDEARLLAVSARPLWQVLLGAVQGREVRGDLLWSGDPLGTSWPVVAWTPR